MMNRSIEISVVVASYNPGWLQLKNTILSVLNQEDIDLEIIVSDDGSSENFFSQLNNLFNAYCFKNYKLIPAEKNQGTCKNLYKGLVVCTGKYIKAIGPGDCLFDAHTLRNWLDFATKHDAGVCFGDAVYFDCDSNPLKLVAKQSFPQNINAYKPELYSAKKAAANYVLLGDAVLGANLITKTMLMKKYLSKVLDKIIYAEDMIYRMMVVNGVELYYYPNNVIWYEYGSGISTSKNDKWSKIIHAEKIITYRFVVESNMFPGIEKFRFNTAVKCLSSKRISWFKYLIYPECIKLKLDKDKVKRFTDIDVDTKLFELVTREKFN